MRIPAKSLTVVMARAGSECELCGDRATQTHHRRPKGSGGSSDPATNRPSNLLRLCGFGSVTGCHFAIESDRTYAYDMGWLVHRRFNPADVPVLLLRPGWVLLTDDGDYEPTERRVA